MYTTLRPIYPYFRYSSKKSAVWVYLLPVSFYRLFQSKKDLPSNILGETLLSLQVGSSSHPAMPHGAIRLDHATDSIIADDLGVALDGVRGLVFGGEDKVGDGQIFRVSFVHATVLG